MTNEELVARISTGIERAESMQQLYKNMCPIMHKLAKRYAAYVEYEDLMQEAYLGLHSAVEHYEPEQGSSFFTYACPWIKQAMYRYVQSESRTVRIPEYMHGLVVKYKKFCAAMVREYGREPETGEIVAYLRIDRDTVDVIKNVMSMEQMQSLDKPVDNDEGETDSYELVIGTEGIEEDAIRKQDAQAVKKILWECVDRLEGQQPCIMRMLYQQGLSRRAAGDAIGTTPKKVRAQELKALRSLREGRNRRMLQGYYVDYIACHAYRGGNEWSSATERTALDLLEIEKSLRNPGKFNNA